MGSRAKSETRGEMEDEMEKLSIDDAADAVNAASGSERKSNTESEQPKATAANPGKEALITSALDQLQGKDYRHVLDVVDRLRLSGLGTILQLPQIVVCGDQSSGKSSVLEAITEVHFPRKENLCTRFATEIIMRRNRTDSIATKIIPDKTRPEEEQAKLHMFRESIVDFNELPDLIDRATVAMGLDSSSTTTRGNRAFTRDVLSIEISGPNRLQLTLVDLPGLIQSANAMQTQQDVTLIHDLVNDYLVEQRTIMLSVVSAKNDYANQAILDKCRRVDPKGTRTLGVVTKPDYLKAGSKNESTWLELVQNKDIHFDLGWHILKNRSEDEMELSFEARNASEASFLGNGAYRSLPTQIKGINALRLRLSQLLYKHLKKELPNLQAELRTKFRETENRLDDLGDKRSTLFEQKRFLMDHSTRYQSIVQAAVDGHYEGSFFDEMDPREAINQGMNLRRLRAAVQYLNLQFASQMRHYGHSVRIWATEETAGTNSKDDLPEPDLLEEYAHPLHKQRTMTRAEAVTWAKDILIHSRGRELPGNFNPLLISQLFWQQSTHWHDLAHFHLNNVYTLCTEFVLHGIEAVLVMHENVSAQLLELTLRPALKRRHDSAVDELEKLLTDKQRSPITYDPSYTASVQEARARKTTARFQALMEKAKVNVDSGEGKQQTVVNPEVLQAGLKELAEPDMDKVSAEDALDSQLAYYKDKVKFFIAAVTEQVIERHMLHDLAANTLSPLVIDAMEEGEVGIIAAEDEETTREREFLMDQKAILESGQEAFRKALGSMK